MHPELQKRDKLPQTRNVVVAAFMGSRRSSGSRLVDDPSLLRAFSGLLIQTHASRNISSGTLLKSQEEALQARLAFP